MFFKLKQICILYTKKPQKKKKMKRNEMNKGNCIAKINCIEKFETQNLRRDTAALVLVEDTKVTDEEEGKM